MGKNIVIVLLVIISFGFLIFAFYQQTVAEKAMVEANNNLILTQQNEARSLEQRVIAKAALHEANNQRKIAEEALAKCK